MSNGDCFSRMISFRAENNTQNVVVVCFSVCKSLDNKRPNAVRIAVPIGGRKRRCLLIELKKDSERQYSDGSEHEWLV